MQVIIHSGKYKLIETKRHTKILYLDDNAYARPEPVRIGELLVYTHKPHKLDCTLSIGAYRVIDVVNEPRLSDQMHLELEVGNGQWQGYLLPTGLPDRLKTRARIIPTLELSNGPYAQSSTLHNMI